MTGKPTSSKNRPTGVTDPPDFPLRVAAIDIGSNAIRFLAAEFSAPQRHRVIDQIRAPVRLGHDVFLTGRLTPEAMDRAVETIATFRERIERLDVTRYRAVATSAVRDSRNGRELINRIRLETGIEVETITGSEEARLAHVAVRSRIDLSTRKWVVADLGGGSVEVSLVDENGIYWTESRGMGSVRLLEELAVAGDEPGRFRRRLEEYTATINIPLAEEERPAGFIATGGNIEALARMIRGETDANGVARVPVSALRSTIEALAKLSYQQRVEELGLREDRADVILPAAMVYERLAELAEMDEVLVPFVGIKDGIIIDLVDDLLPEEGRNSRHDRIAWAGAIALGERYHFDAPHGRHVATLALSLFDQLTDVHELDADSRRILMVAALLHDIGTFIAYRKHHKHSQYIIAESDLPGFSQSEIQVIANVARYHRRSTPSDNHDSYTKLRESDRDRVVRLAAILRLADALDREHRQAVSEVRARHDGGKVHLELKGDGDLLLERWALEKKAEMFEKVFKLPLKAVDSVPG